MSQFFLSDDFSCWKAATCWVLARCYNHEAAPPGEPGLLGVVLSTRDVSLRVCPIMRERFCASLRSEGTSWPPDPGGHKPCVTEHRGVKVPSPRGGGH